jgi:hypothetical protein
MKEPTRPPAWANLLISMWGEDRFPVCVRRIALEYSQRFPDPILFIKEAPVDTFEGALAPLKKKGGWAILYNPNIASSGRINFTLAHELGHYLVHRAQNPGGFECSQGRVLGFDKQTAQRQIEQEADAFASYLLMPATDYRSQVGRNDMTLELLRHCADRYDVSMTAAAIKWLDLTDKCAALVVATNGFVLWCWRSSSARKRGIFFGQGMELPVDSLAGQPGLLVPDCNRGITLDGKVWGASTQVREMAIFADRYEMTISLLIFDDADGGYDDWQQQEEDTFDRFNR